MDLYVVLCFCVSVCVMKIDATMSNQLLLLMQVFVLSIYLEVFLLSLYSKYTYSFTGFCQIAFQIILLDLFLSIFWFYCDCEWKFFKGIISIVADRSECYRLGGFNLISSKGAELSHPL